MLRGQRQRHALLVKRARIFAAIPNLHSTLSKKTPSALAGSAATSPKENSHLTPWRPRERGPWTAATAAEG